MLLNYIKIAIRNLKRHIGYSLINFVGLSISITIVLLILIYIPYELSFDRYHKNADRIYRVVQEFPYYYKGKNQAPVTPGPLAATLIAELPEVVSAARLIGSDHTLISYSDKNFVEQNFCFADPQLFAIFSFDMIKGNPQEALKHQQNL